MSSHAAAASSSPASQAGAGNLVDPAAWAAAPSIVWALLVFLLLLYFRSELVDLIRAFVLRIQDGAAFKVAGFEISAASAVFAKPGRFSAESDAGDAVADDGTMARFRSGIYEECRGGMLVHQLQRSREPGQQYDVLIYLVPHKTSFAGIAHVEYFFGRMWGDRVFPSNDRSRGFPIVTSAYGPFLCAAKIHFNDGESVQVYRYVDFEMGGVAPNSPDR